MRKICVITGTRADYGLLKWVMEGIKNDSKLELLVVVTGSHLSSIFGNTFKLIESDGFKILNSLVNQNVCLPSSDADRLGTEGSK